MVTSVLNQLANNEYDIDVQKSSENPVAFPVCCN